MLHSALPRSLALLMLIALAVPSAGCDCAGRTDVDRRRDGGGDVSPGRDTGPEPMDAPGEEIDAGPSDELCNGLDDDGDGRVDEVCSCAIGDVQSCYPGDPALGGVGTCTLGTQTCLETSMEFGAWGACTGATPPDAEVCDGRDNDCDGVVDDGCECSEGDTRPCYDGPAGTEGIGICAPGAQTCVAGPGGVGTAWDVCDGSITPSATESCNGRDDTCDGAIDEGCGCTEGVSRSCYTGPGGTEGVGLCRAGTQYCVDDGGSASWGACVDPILPVTDVCNGIDDDCDGTADEDCLCPPGSLRGCYTGDPASRGIGLCRDGVQTCELAPGGAGSDWGSCGGERLPAEELCDGADNDCDGTIDEGCGCPLGESRVCYSGPPDTLGYGACRSGMQTCVAGTDGMPGWGPCGGEIAPGPEVCFDGIDGDCDGVIDDGCNCTEGASRACYGGPPETRSVGMCRDGLQDCELAPDGVGADWGACTGDRRPASETCDGIDNNCDGTADEGCSCAPGTVRSCYTGPGGTLDVGICRGGSQTCDVRPDGAAEWSACAGATLPDVEACNGRDDDCDGVTDEGCTCDLGMVRDCYEGPAATRGVGICTDGTQSCVASGGGSAWGACSGATEPGTETCNGRDDNCDGTVDEGCSCTPRTTRSCYTGPEGTDGVGVCRAGSQTCNLSTDGTSSSWGTCAGVVLPGGELCNGIDDDCDGVTDDGCACAPGTVRACYDGTPASTRGVGICRDGTQTCVSGPGGVGSSWGACAGWTGPATEICDGSDNDCDAFLDEGCACSSGDTRACYSGPPATRSVGECRDGAQMCSISGGVAGWGTCSGERLPATETCNSRDDDCDGVTDDGACSVPPTITCPPPTSTRPLVPVTLTGSASDPDGGPIVAWTWTLVSSPAGSTGTFSAPASPTTQFTPNLVGVYTIQLTVRDDEGQTASCTMTVTAAGDGIRIEVSWNTNYTDIDTHLLRMSSPPGWFSSPLDCYYGNTRPSWDAAGTADDPRLDIDDVEGFGPENINVDAPVVGGTYRVGIHYFDDDICNCATSVTVRIYCGDITVTPVATYTRNLTGGGGTSDANDFWRVANIVWNGADSCSVTAINTLTTGGTARTAP